VACRQSFVDLTTASAGMIGQSLYARECEDGRERVDRETPVRRSRANRTGATGSAVKAPHDYQDRR
jgi:hypothetical protein